MRGAARNRGSARANAGVEYVERMSRTIRIVFTAVVLVLAAFQLVSVTLAALPTNAVSEAARPATDHLKPYFTQNWRLFAPNPISADRRIEFRARYRSDGVIGETPWLDWTGVELDLVRHRLIGGRAGYVTNKMFSPLASAYSRLDGEQRKVADSDDEAALAGWDELAQALRAAGDTSTGVRSWIAYERTAAQLATQALSAAHPDVEPVAVQYRLVTHKVTPYRHRGLSAAERERRRPAPSVRTSGWRLAEPGTPQSQAVFDSFWDRHR